MSIIYSYPTSQPTVDDLLIGTDVADDNATKSFTVQSLVSLINAAAGSGTLTSVTISTDAFLTVAGNPTGPAVAYTIGLAATGTPSATTFLRGDNQWVVPTVTSGIGIYSSNILVTNDLSSANFTGAGVTVASDVNGNVSVNVPGATNAVESVNAGSGISLNSTTGNIIVTNTGITGLVEGGGITITTNLAGQATLVVPASASGTVTSVAPGLGLVLSSGDETINPVIGLNYGTVAGAASYVNAASTGVPTSTDSIPFNDQTDDNVKKVDLGDIPLSALTLVGTAISTADSSNIKNNTDSLPSVNKVLNVITLTDAEYTAIGTGNYVAGTLYLTTSTSQPQNTVNFTVNTSAINATGSCGFTQSTTVNGSVVNPIAVTGAVNSNYTVATTITPTGSNCSISGGSATQTITGTIPATPTPAAVTQTLAARTISAPAPPGNVNDTLTINTNNITGTQFTTSATNPLNGTQGSGFNTSDFSLTATANTGYEFSGGVTTISIPTNGTYNQSTSTYGSNSTIGTFNATNLSLKSYPVSYTVTPSISGGAYNLTITSTSNTFSGSATSGSSTALFGTNVDVTATITPTGTDVISPNPLFATGSLVMAASGNVLNLGTLTGSISASTSSMTLNPTTSFTPAAAWSSPAGQWGYSINGGTRGTNSTVSASATGTATANTGTATLALNTSGISGSNNYSVTEKYQINSGALLTYTGTLTEPGTSQATFTADIVPNSGYFVSNENVSYSPSQTVTFSDNSTVTATLSGVVYASRQNFSYGAGSSKCGNTINSTGGVEKTSGGSASYVENGDTVYTSTSSSTLLANGNYTGNINNVTNPSSGGFTVTSGIVSGVTSCP